VSPELPVDPEVVTVELDVQYAAPPHYGLPVPAAVRRWVEAALAVPRGRAVARGAELTVRIVDSEEGARLNRTYRRRTGPTNVLSFPLEAPAGVDVPLLGDVVVCAPVVIAEARVQDGPPDAHWAHVVVHGVLHLLGYDHEAPDEARVMERQEARVLARLGYADPYAR
jgi:probable rRNA maturation factor